MIQLRVYANSMLKAIEPLSDEEIGRLFVAMLNYTVDKTASPLPGNEKFLWGFVKDSLDAQHDSYEKRCATNKANRNGESSRIVTNRHESSQIQVQVQDQVQVKSLKSSKGIVDKFVPPTVQEVSEYCAERGNNVDPEHFVAHYESNGWKVGRNSMKDWKAAVRSWERRMLEHGDPKTTNQFLQLLTEEGGQL